MKIANDRLPDLSTPQSVALLTAALRTKEEAKQTRKAASLNADETRKSRFSAVQRAVALTILAALGCGEEAEKEEEPVEEEAAQEEPILPVTPLYCEPEITCAGPAISNEAGFSQIEVGVRLRNEGCWDPQASKNVWLGAAPANRRVVTETGVDVQPNFPDDLLDQDTATVMPITPTQSESRENIRRIVTVPQGDGNSFLVALQSNDILVDAAGRNHAARVNADEVSAHPAIPLDACFQCLTEDTRACGEMQPWERDYCTWRYHPSIEYVIGQISRPIAPETDVSPCDTEPEEGNGEQASVRKMIRDVFASYSSAKEENREAFRSFVASRKAA